MLAKLAPLAALALLAVACSGASDDSSTTGSTDQNMSTAIHTTYGITTFGGPGDYQTLACTGKNSRVDQQWYVASSQRYGCGVHLKITTASGKCVVARTDDAGPATFVEQRAGVAVLDSSPSVTNHLFPGVGELGYTDLHAHPGRYNVTVVKTTMALGPCEGSAGSDTSGGDTSGGDTSSGDTGSGDTGGGSSSGGGSSGGGSSGGGSSGGGASCSHDGDCNPGNDGSGLICSGGQCIPGCHSDAQCPGNTTCQSGQCQ
jgi:hypothetical protein